MPGNMAGSPPHPGSSPVQAPGSGAGNSAAAVAQIKAVLPVMFNTLSAFPAGSKEYKAVLSSVQALNPIFSEPDAKNLVPAAVQQMAMAAKGGPLQSAPAPGLANAPSPDEKPPMAA